MSRCPFLLGMLLIALPAGPLLGACQPQSPLLAKVFQPLPPAVPVKRLPRHPPPPKPVAPVVVAEETVKPEPVDWAALYQKLPRDDDQAVDWMQALSDGLIKPRPGLAADAAELDSEDAEVKLVPAKKPSKAATFRHVTHTQWLACNNCHNAIFRKKSDNLQFTHDDMDNGKFCGACHDKVVLAPSGCEACHGKKS